MKKLSVYYSDGREDHFEIETFTQNNFFLKFYHKIVDKEFEVIICLSKVNKFIISEI